MTQTIEFTKMHGLGNDFVVIDGYRRAIELSSDQIRHIADRHLGVGCDQLLLVERSDRPDVDFRYRIFNADGGEVEQCGNGARCFARFVRDHGLTDKDEITVETAKGIIYPRIEADGQVTVNMGLPDFEPAHLPFQAESRQIRYDLAVDGRNIEIGAVSMGNPHAVTCVESIDAAPVQALGPAIEGHPRFPKRVNAGFMQILNRNHIRLRVYERGAGETMACGTGACAAAVIGRLWGMLDETIAVDLPGGRLEIHWRGEGTPVFMKGPAVQVFEGTIQL